MRRAIVSTVPGVSRAMGSSYRFIRDLARARARRAADLLALPDGVVAHLEKTRPNA